MNIKELDLLEKQDAREKFVSRTEVLDKVGELLLLPNTEYATTEQVANYYDVGISAITSLVYDNRKEIESDGYKIVKRKDIDGSFEIPLRKFKSMRGKTVITLLDNTEFNVTNTGMALFPKRAILRVGMLLRDSEVAKEVRTRLLDIVHDTEQSAPEIVQNVVAEITEERQLMLDRVEAEMNGDYDLVSVINAKLFAMKNRRIAELEGENTFIRHNALTIIKSRDVINRLVRMIAVKKYNGRFGKAWGELYTKVNYKLGINIKARDKKKNESYINTLTEEETFEVEKIVRSWAVDVGLDLDKLLKIA